MYRYDENFVQTVMVVTIVLSAAFALLFLTVFHLFEGFALYRLSKNRGYQRAWLAFIPVVNSWVLGGIADHIGLCAGKKELLRGICLGICSFWSVFHLISMILQFYWIWDVLPISLQSGNTEYLYIYGLLQESPVYRAVSVLSPILTLLGFLRLGAMGFCWNSIFRDYAGNNAMLYLILSLISGLLLGQAGLAPFFLFAVRNKPSASLYWASQRQSYPPQPPFYPQQR